MEFEFDKEIDAILRKAQESEFALAVGTQQSHLDADEISAFAENALPERAKRLYTTHLADCDRCRRILSNIISLNSEPETIPAFVATEEKTAAPVAPWYRRLFVFPALAYSLGALLLVFGGLIGFTVLQSMKNGDLSQVSEKAMNTNRAAVSNSSNSAAAANTATSNTANSVMNANSAAIYSTNSTANTAVSNSSVKPDSASKEKPQNPAKKNDEYYCQDCGSGDEATKQEPVINEDNKDAVTTRSLPQPTVKKESDKNNTADITTERNSASVQRDEDKPKLSSKSSGTTTGETMTVSGKTFNRRDNVWYDSAYNNQATTNITRGSQEYKKLDRDLRQTVERIGGTVVIVWKSKAYRIQ